MPQPIPYLAFDGNCADAMRHYAIVLGGRLDVVTNRQTPFADRCPADHLDRVAHAHLKLEDGTSLYAGDCPPHMQYQGMHGVSITLNYDEVDEAERVFGGLSDGGAVTMPFAETFWAKKSGIATDRFGCHWIVNAALTDMRPAG